jgi:hypothetical protein
VRFLQRSTESSDEDRGAEKGGKGRREPRERAYHVGAGTEDGTHAHKAVVLDRARLQHAPVTCTIVPTPTKESVSSHEAKRHRGSQVWCIEGKKGRSKRRWLSAAEEGGLTDGNPVTNDRRAIVILSELFVGLSDHGSVLHVASQDNGGPGQEWGQAALIFLPR